MLSTAEKQNGPHVCLSTVDYVPGSDAPDALAAPGDRHVTRHRSDTLTCVPDATDRRAGVTPVDLAVSIVRMHGAVTPTNGPEWQPHTWYEVPPYPLPQSGTGEWRAISVHVHGLSDDDSREVYRRITGH